MTGTGRRRDALFNENPDATDWVKNTEGGLTDSDWIASLTPSLDQRRRVSDHKQRQ
jgi:hypothetical protein